MTDTMQALYRYTAEGRFSSYLTGADYREVCRVLDKQEQTLRQLLPAGERDLLSRLETARLEQRDLELEAMFQAAWAAAPVTDVTGGGNLKGKQPKRRLWRKKRGCFEAAARLAAPNRGRESECRNGADEVPSLSAQLSHFSSSARSWSAKRARLLLSRPRERLMASMTICPTATSRS